MVNTFLGLSTRQREPRYQSPDLAIRGSRLKKLEADLECPNCHRKFKQRVADMRPGTSRRCLGCGTIIEFAGDNGRQVQKAIDDLERSMKRILRNLKFKL